MKQPITILAVGESAVDRLVLGAILGASGHNIILAEGGCDALEQLEVLQPDLILTSYVLPHEQGLELVYRIRACSEFDSVPIFVVSKEQSPEARSRMAVAGANAWIAMPICPPVLMGGIEAAAISLGWSRSRPHSDAGFALAS